MHDESNIGAWLWLILIVSVNALWVGMDVWLHYHHHELLTQEMQEGISGPFGPFIAGLVAFSVTAFVVHMWLS